MNILFLEDRGSVTTYLSGALKKMGHIVFDAFNIYDAREKWENFKIECIILDLNLNAAGLLEKEKKETINGKITGWIWFENYVLEKNPFFKKRTIIYSEYIDELEDSKYTKHSEIIKIRKRGSRYEDVINKINLIGKIQTIENILLVGNENSIIFNTLKKKLKDNEFNYFDEHTIAEANNNLNKTLGFIILELALKTEGLSEKEKSQAQGGQITGKIWLREKVFKEYPYLTDKTILLMPDYQLNKDRNKILSEFAKIKLISLDILDTDKIIQILKENIK
jgi:hypothetical protein